MPLEEFLGHKVGSRGFIKTTQNNTLYSYFFNPKYHHAQFRQEEKKMSPHRVFKLWVFFLILILDVIVAVDKNKFKKCEESSFCKRNRDFATSTNYGSIKNQTKLDISSMIRYSHDRVGFTLHTYQNKPLQIQFTALSENIFRIQVSENENNKRYQGPTEVLMPFVDNANEHSSLEIIHTAGTNKAEIKFGTKGYGVMKLHPWRLGNC